MELKLTFGEIKYLERLCSYSPEITFKIDISEQAVQYCKELIETNYKIFKNLFKDKLKDDGLYKKLCETEKDKGGEK